MANIMTNIEILFKEISNTQAFEKIFVDDIDNLYFAYQYVESQYAYGDGHLPTPFDLKITEPIKYGKVIKRNFLTKKVTKISKPEKLDHTAYRFYRGHTWLIKEVKNDGKHLEAPFSVPRKG